MPGRVEHRGVDGVGEPLPGRRGAARRRSRRHRPRTGPRRAGDRRHVRARAEEVARRGIGQLPEDARPGARRAGRGRGPAQRRWARCPAATSSTTTPASSRPSSTPTTPGVRVGDRPLPDAHVTRRSRQEDWNTMVEQVDQRRGEQMGRAQRAPRRHRADEYSAWSLIRHGLSGDRLATGVPAARPSGQLRRRDHRRRRARAGHRLLPGRRPRHHATSPCWRRATSAAAGPGATPRSCAPTT